MTIQEIRARLSAIAERQKALKAGFDKNGTFTADERTEAKTLRTEADGLKTQLAAHETQEAEDRGLIGDAESLAKELGKPNPPKVQPGPIGNIGNPREALADDPARGFKTHREFLTTVMAAGTTGRVDKRLEFCRSKVSEQLAAGSDEHGTYADAYGNFLLPPAFSPNLMTVMAEEDPIAPLTTKIPMEAAVVDIPARTDKNHTNSVTGGLRVYRRAETQAAADSRMAIEQVTLRATSLMGVAYATEELLARSPISFVALLDAGFRDEFAAKLIDERLNGTGTGMFEGVTNCPATVSVSKETGQAGVTIVKENIDKMRSRCWGYGRAVWLYNHDCLPQLRSLVQVIGAGGASVPYFQVDADGNSTLDGRPAFATEFTKTLGTVGDLVLGNWSQYLEGILTGMNQAESVHVRFLNHERTFKFWMENDGRCWWRSALTPKNSTNTLSPFITLATRA